MLNQYKKNNNRAGSQLHTSVTVSLKGVNAEDPPVSERLAAVRVGAGALPN